jgi:hypothetical protein
VGCHTHKVSRPDIETPIEVCDYREIVAAPRCPKCQSDQLDEDWGRHDAACPLVEHRHLICTNVECGFAFTAGPTRAPRS